MADYIFTVEGLLDKSKILSDFQGIKNTIEGQDLIIHFDGDPKSLKGLIDQIKAQKPEAKITFQADKKSMEQIFGNLEGKAFQFDPNNAKLRQAFDDIQKVAEKRLAGVDLSKFYAEAANAFIDPTKSGLELLDVTSKISDKINTLAGITNRLSLRDLGPSDLDEVLKKAQALADIRKQIADEKKDNRKYGDFTDLKEAEKKAIDNTLGQGERKQPIGQKRIDDAIKSLGLKNDVKRDYGETLKEYARYSEYANELYEKLNSVKFDQITSKTDAKEKLNQVQELIAISKKAAKIEEQLRGKGVLSESQSLLPAKPDKLIQTIGNKAAKAYTDVLMKSLTNAEAQAENNLNQYIANKSKQRTTEGAGRAEKTSAKTEEIVEKNTARTRRRTKQGGGEGTSGGEGGPAETAGDYERATGAAEGLGQAGRAAGEGVAAGAEAASESLDELQAKLNEAKQRLQELKSANTPIKDMNPKDFRSNHVFKEFDKLNSMYANKSTPAEDIEKQEKYILDLAKTYDNAFEKSFGKSLGVSLINGRPEQARLLDSLMKKYKDYTPNLIESFGDPAAIKQQEELIDSLTTKINELRQSQQQPPTTEGSGITGMTDDLKELEAELEQAKAKLEDLKNASSNLTPDSEIVKKLTKEFDGLINKYNKSVDGEADFLDADYERFMKIYNTLSEANLLSPIEGRGFSEEIKDKYADAFETVDEVFNPDGIKEFTSLTEDAIAEQEAEVARLTQRITELRKLKPSETKSTQKSESSAAGDKSGETKEHEVDIKANTSTLRSDIEGVLASPFEVVLKPSDSLRGDIQNILDGAFDINVNGLSGKSSEKGSRSNQSPSQIISDMMKADSFMSKNYFDGDYKSLRERAMFFNTKTGYHTNPFIFDENNHIDSNKILDIVSEAVDAQVHTHPRERSWMSIDNVNEETGGHKGDFKNFLYKYANRGINTQIVAAQKEAQIFDVEKFVKDYGNMFGSFKKGKFVYDENKTQNFLKKFSEAKDKHMNDFYDNYNNVLQLLDIVDDATLNFSSFFDNAKNIKGKHPDAKNIISALGDDKTLSADFWGYAKTRKKDDQSLYNVAKEFLIKRLEGAAQNGKLDLGDYTALDLFKGMAAFQDGKNPFSKILREFTRDKHNGDPAAYLSRLTSDQAFKDLGIPNFLKNYNKIMPIDELTHFFDVANEKTGFNPAAVDGEINSLKQKTQVITEEGEAAEKAKQQKEDFAKANEHVSQATDSKPIEEATDKIDDEGEAAKKAKKEKEEFAAANEKIVEVTDPKPLEQASDAIQDEAESASKGKKEKEDFAKANEHVAESANETAAKTKEAINDIEDEGEAVDKGGWGSDQITELLGNISHLKETIDGISTSFTDFAGNLDVSGAIEGMNNLSSAIDEVKKKIESLTSATENLDLEGLGKAFGKEEITQSLTNALDKLEEVKGVFSQGFGLGEAGAEAPINNLITAFERLARILEIIQAKGKIDIDLGEGAEQATENLNNDKAKSDTKNKKNIENETGSAMKKVLDEIYNENAEVGITGMTHEQWQRVLAVSGKYKDQLGDIVDVQRSMLDQNDEMSTMYDITTTKGKFRIYDSGAVGDKTKMGDELTQQKEREKEQKKINAQNLKDAEAKLKQYEKAVEKVSDLHGEIAANKIQGKEDLAIVGQWEAAKQAAEEAKVEFQSAIDVLDEANKGTYQEKMNKLNQELERPETTENYENNEFEAIAESINKCYEAAKNFESIREKFDIGQATQRQLDTAAENMNKSYEAAERGMKRLEEMNAQKTNRHATDETVEAGRGMLKEIQEIRSGVSTNGDFGFETEERSWATLIKNADKYAKILQKQKDGQKLNYSDISFLDKYGQKYNEATEKIQKTKEAQEELTESQQKFESKFESAKQNAFESSMQNMENELNKLNDLYLNDDGAQALTNLRRKYDDITKAVKEYGRESKQAKEAISTYRTANRDFDQTYRSGYYTAASDEDIAMTKRRMMEYAQKNTRDTETISWINSIKDSLDGISAGGLSDVNAQLDEFRAKAAESGNVGKTFGDTLKKSFQGLARYLMTYVGFYEVVDALKQAVNIVKELDTGLMEVRKVSTEPLSNLKDWQKDTFRQADMVGSTAQQIQESTASWLRLGKSFTEAQDAAVASNWLLNVSEFENIDEATTSLMSITQAFNDLSFEDVIDKLNAVGDSYSSSTDQLASGLQNAAAVLKIQGNDIDKSLALLTAGNDITQDMSKTSAGIRTISLRIAGTEEAKNEIADLGEDVDDFVVRTRSKTDKIVKDYTAVASNDFKGVSVLDSKGGLRDTYDILLDIADIYKEIQETDKKAGTNRAQALVEELAGKNRSNILASILQNPELLRNVYNTSVNSAGVGMKELEAYTDSVSAKIQTLQNHLQELATVTIDSEWLKDLIDLGTSAVEIVTQLVDKIGGLEGVAGILGGLFAQGKGWGFVTPRDKDGKRELGFLGNVFSKLGGFVDKGFTNGFKNAFRDVFKSDQRDAAKWLRGFDQDASIKDMFGFTGNETDSRVRETLIDNGATDEIADTLAGMLSENLEEPISNLADGLGDIGSIGGVIKSGIKDFGIGLLSSVGTMGVSMIASGILSFLGNWAVKKITGQEHTEKIQAGQEAAAQNKQSRERIETIEDTGNKALERYNKLRQGVYMNGNIAKNISLSSDEYAEFLDISQQLADVFPSLQTGVTDAGQSLVDLGTDADEATEKLQKMIDAEKQINVNDIKSKMDKTTTGIAEKNKEYEDSIKAEESRIAGIQRIQSSLQNLKVGANEVDFGDFKTYKESAKILMNMLDDVGIGYAGFMDPGNMGVLKFNVDKDSLQDVENVFAAYQDILNGNMQTAQDSIESFEDQEQANWLTNFLPDFKEILESDPAFINMGEDINNGIFEMLNKIDYPAMYEMLGDDLKPDERYDEALANAIITPFETALASEDIKPIDLSNFLEFNFDDLSNEDMRDAINGMLDKVFPGGEGTNDYKIKQMILVEFGYKYEDEDGNTHWNATDTRASLWEKLGGEVTKNTSGKNVFKQGTSPIKWEDFKQISQEYQQIMSEMGGDFHFTGDSFEALIDYLHQWKVAQEQIEEKPIGKLSDIFENESFQQDTQKAEQNISTLQTAIDNFRESGKLTSEQLTNLYSSIPELAKYGDDLTLENLGDELWKNVQDYGKTFNQAVSDLDLSPDEISAATNYLQSYFDQFANAPLSINQAKDALHDFIVTTTDVKSPAEAAQRGVEEKRYNDILTQLSDTGREIDWEVVMQIMADPSMANATAEEFVAEYDQKEITIHAKIEFEDMQRDLQNYIEGKESGISAQQALISAKQAAGERVTAEDYMSIRTNQAAIVGSNKRLYDMAYENFQNAKMPEDIKYWQNEANKAFATWQNSQADYIQYQKDSREADVNYLNQVASEHEALGERLNNEKTQIEESGRMIDRKLASQIARNRQDQIATQEAIAAENENLYSIYGDSSYLQSANTARAAAQTIRDSGTTTQQIISESQVASLNADLTELQDKATTIQDAITLQEGQGLKPTLDQYNQLLDNGAKQIDNLEKQNRLLGNQQVGLRRNSARWREIQSQINANNSAISQMNGNLNNWRDSIKNFAGDIGNTLLSALQNAFSESTSSTGLQYGTMKELAAQFEGLQGFDFQDIFYNTAQGVKLDARATERLVDAQYGLMTGDLASQINVQNESLSRLTAEYQNTSDAAEKAKISMKMDDVNLSLNNLYNQMAQYQAFYAEAQKLFSGFGEFQRAQQTADAGDTYNSLQSYFKTQEEAYQAGLIGTDDFKAYTAIFDEWGRDSLAAYTENRDKIQRYLTDDNTGPAHLLDDLVNLGYGTKDDDYNYNLDLPNLREASHALGVSEEFLDYALQRTEDYGFTNDYVSNQVQGELKLQEAAHDTAEAIRKRNELIAQGAPQEIIDEYTQKIEALDQTTQNVRENIQDVVAREGKITSSEIKGAVNSINELNKRAREARKEGRDAEAAEFMRQVENIADEAGIKLDPTGRIDYKQLNKDYKGWYKEGAAKQAEDINTAEIENVKLEGQSIENNEALRSGLGKLKNGWDDNVDAVQDYVNALKGANVDDLKALDLNDGKVVEGLEDEEAALDNLARTFGLTAEEAQFLVPILQELGLIGQSLGETYTRVGQGGTLGVSTANAESLLAGTKYEGVTQFDAANMSADELMGKMRELSGAALSIDVEAEGGQEALDEINQLYEATKKEYNVKVGIEKMQELGIDAEEFLGMSKEEQLHQMITFGVDASNYEAFVAHLRSQTIQTKIESYLEDHTQEELNGITEDNYEVELGISADTASWEEVKAEIDSYDEEQIDIKVAISHDSIVEIGQSVAAALNGEEYEVSVGTTADTTEAEGEIQQLNDEKVTVTADADTSNAESKVRNSIEGKVYTAKVNVAVQNSGGFLSRLSAGAKTQTVTTKVDDKASGTIDRIKKSASSGANMKLSVSGAEQLNRISTQIENARKSASQAIKVNIDTSQTSTAVSTLTSRINEIKKTVASPMTINIDTSQTAMAVQTIVDRINEAKTAAAEPIMVTVEPSGQDRVDALREAIELLQDKQVTVQEQGASASTARVVLLRSAINSLQSKSIAISSTVSGLAQVNSLRDSIAALQSKQITITTVYQTIGSPSGGSTKIGGVASRIGGATGTLSSIGSAYAKGTFDEDGRVAKSGSAYNVINYKDAKSKGDVALKRDTDALTNELGTESLIRNGRWLLLPGGPHIEHLKRGDIVE